MTYRQLIKNNKLLMYKILFKNVKNITAKVDKNNEVVVTCPTYIELSYVDDFVLKYFDKFYDFIDNKKNNSLININDNKITLLGISYDIKINFVQTKEKYEIIDNKIYLFLRNENNKQKLIYKLLKDLGNDFLIKRTKYWLKIIDDNAYSIETKWYESKWGQCEYRTKSITLAIQLYMLNLKLIDYVIIHEICHLEFPNHSNLFWAKVEKFYPEWKIAKEKLKYN